MAENSNIEWCNHTFNPWIGCTKVSPADPNWFRSLRDQCADTDTPFLFKQWGGINQKQIKALGRELDGVIHDGYPKRTPAR